jgi:hypothetical protein
MGGSAGNRHLDPTVVSSSLEQSSNAPSAPMPNAQKGDRPQIHDTIVREIGRDAPAEASQSQNLSSASTTSVGTTPLSPPASKQSTVARRHTALTGAKAEELRTPTKFTRTPETRPTTIKGWTLREVTNGTAVLEGPNGVWRAKPGQTVPGVGEGGLHCSLGESFDSRDEQRSNLDPIKGCQSEMALSGRFHHSLIRRP